MAKKTSRKPRAVLSVSQKDYIYKTVEDARQKGLEQETVLKSLAEELGCSHYTARNVYFTVKRQLKEKGEPETDGQNMSVQTELVESPIVPTNEVTPEPSPEFSIEVEETKPKEDVSELIHTQSNILLDRIEKLVEERNHWKAMYEASNKENIKLKEKVVSILLD